MGSLSPSHPRPGHGIKTSDECLLRRSLGAALLPAGCGRGVFMRRALATLPK